MSEVNKTQQEEKTPAAREVAGRDQNPSTPPEGRFKPRRRKKVSYLTINKITQVDYKDLQILRRFVNDYGKIVPSRQSGTTAKQQRMIARAVKRAREMALLPFVTRELVDRYTPGAGRRFYDNPRYRSTEAQQSSPATPAAETTA